MAPDPRHRKGDYSAPSRSDYLVDHTRTIHLSHAGFRAPSAERKFQGTKMPTPTLVFNASKVLIGNTNSPKLVIVAAVIVLVWMFMDVCQFVDWLQTKINSSTGLPFPI
jgi:hypothetical protein